MVDCLIFLTFLAGFLALSAYTSCASKSPDRSTPLQEITEADENMVFRMERYAAQKSPKSKQHTLAKAA